MFNLKVLTATFAVVSVFSGVNGHPGEKHSAAHVKREIERYSSAHAQVARAFSKIHEFPHAAALKERAIARRFRTWKALREKRGIVSKPSFEKRTLEDLERYLNISHDETQLGYTLETPLEVIFGKNATAALVPEAIIGPYFASGELLRQDVTENLAGVPMRLDIQFLDINTMKPVKDLYVDIWHCNALGVYSGVNAEGQAGLNTTWLRGFQVTSPEGVVEFDTIVPGHYGGRAHHIHVLTTINSTMLPNHTYIAGVTNHVGQLFLEQSLLDEVETTVPYNENTQSLMKVVEDSIAADVSTAVVDPLMKYVRLSDDIQDGVLAYITVGIDLKANHSENYQPAAHWQEGGGVELSGWVPVLVSRTDSQLPSATSSAAVSSS